MLFPFFGQFPVPFFFLFGCEFGFCLVVVVARQPNQIHHTYFFFVGWAQCSPNLPTCHLPGCEFGLLAVFVGFIDELAIRLVKLVRGERKVILVAQPHYTESHPNFFSNCKNFSPGSYIAGAVGFPPLLAFERRSNTSITSGSELSINCSNESSMGVPARLAQSRRW